MLFKDDLTNLLNYLTVCDLIEINGRILIMIAEFYAFMISPPIFICQAEYIQTVISVCNEAVVNIIFF